METILYKGKEQDYKQKKHEPVNKENTTWIKEELFHGAQSDK